MSKYYSVYLDEAPPLKVDHSLIFQPPNRIIFINIDNDSIILKNSTVWQVHNYKHFVIKDTNNLYRVIQYDGVVIVPFEFYRIFILDDIIKVQKNKDSDYEEYCKLPK